MKSSISHLLHPLRLGICLLLAACGSSSPTPGHDAAPMDAKADAPKSDGAKADGSETGDGPTSDVAPGDSAATSDGPSVADVGLGDGATDTSATNDAGAADGQSGDGGSPLFAAVQAIFDAHCTSCHDASLVPTPIPDRPPVYPQLPLTDGASYAALVGEKAPDACGGTLVVPGHPEQSYLYTIVSIDNPCTGQRMPRGGGNIRPPGPLSDAEQKAISAWITAGAPR